VGHIYSPIDLSQFMSFTMGTKDFKLRAYEYFVVCFGLTAMPFKHTVLHMCSVLHFSPFIA
jgi:hypothetical protein